MRSLAVSLLKESNEPPYPHKFHVGMSLQEFIERFNHIDSGEILDDVVTVAGD